ncbi:MAG: AHH domain-containing protein [Saprospiraceae bacterium]
MKRNVILMLATLLALSLFSCKKDILNEDFEDEQSGFYKQNFSAYQWSEKESNFFSLNPNRSSSSLDMRNEEYPTIYQPLLVEAYNEIARQNEIHGFVSQIATKAGFPDWASSYVSRNSNNQENLVIIPLLFDNQNKLSGLIIANKQISPAGSRWSINGISREELLAAGTGHPLQKGALAHWILNYEHRYFQTENEALKDAYCVLKTRGENETIVNSPVFNPPPDCTWRILEVCSDDETQIFWQAGVDMIPLHLDHDRDGILNQNDQDWYEFIQRHNITQEQFTQAIDSWWEDHYQDEYGDYDDFWDEVDLDGGEDITAFLNGLWDDLEDFFNDIFDDGIFFPNLDNQVDPYDPDDCPGGGDGGPLGDPFTSGGEIGFRDVRCNYYYIQDCGTGAANWWQFTDWITCPNCTEQDIENENQWFYIRLNAYIDNYRLDNYRDLLLSITANVPVLLSEDEVFQLFSTAFLDHFLDQHSGITLSSEERKWLIERPRIIAALWDHSAISGQGEITVEGLDVIINLCIALNLNELEAGWLIQDAHLHGGESPVGEGLDEFLDEIESYGDPEELTAAKQAALSVIKLHQAGLFYGPYDSNYEAVLLNAAPGLEVTNPVMMLMIAVRVAELKFENQTWCNNNPKKCSAWALSVAVWEVILEQIHVGLDIIGLIPGAEIADVFNGVIYTVQGQGANATLSFTAAVPIAGWAATTVKWAKKTISVSGRNFRLFYIVDANNLIRFGNGNAENLRRQMRRILKTPAGDQAHHILPLEFWDRPLVQKAASATGPDAFHMNELFNGISLPTSRHSGYHTLYSGRIQARLNEWHNAFPNATPAQAAEKLRDWLTGLKNTINTSTAHINDIVPPVIPPL